jgi:superfamily II DNA or RNA helicase
MHYAKKTHKNKEEIKLPYNKQEFKEIYKLRWNPYKDEPVQNISELCYLLRKVVNSDGSRVEQILEIYKQKKKVIIFYNFDYELEILREMCEEHNLIYSEWNGHKHEPIQKGNEWVYLVQYTSGAEGWNCIETDTIIFYSLNYSYKIMTQAAGRIDRLNTKYSELYYYYLYSNSPIDLGIKRALDNKKKFNEESLFKNKYSK